MDPKENNQWLILVVIAAPVVYYWLQIARRKREVVRYKIRRVAFYAGCVLIAVATIPSHGYSTQDAAVVGMLGGAAGALLFINPPKTDRRIPTKIRRAVIARFEAKGEKFNRKIHDIDHIVPFSKGGDHSLENLRVVHRSENRKRGAKMPGFRDFF